MASNQSLKKTFDSRPVAAEIINNIISSNKSLNPLLAEKASKVKVQDRSLLQEICYGALRHYFSLSTVINHHLQKPLKQKDSDIQALLIVGAYQLLHTRVPNYAAIDSTVNGVEYFKKRWARGLVNAVLRKISGLSDTQLSSISRSEAEIFDHPQWIIDLIKKYYPETYTDILATNNQRGPMTLRINHQQNSRDKYLALLKESNIEAEPTLLSRAGVQLSRAMDVEDVPGFEDGKVSVQDEAAQLCAFLLQVDNDMSVLDACAAPGGKTCHIKELSPSAKLTALDVDESRCQQVNDNLKRLLINDVTVLAVDGTKPKQWWQQKLSGILFDRILLDAPCSATGVIRRHPDIKLLRRASDISALVDTQLSLLVSLWPLLKPRGILLYTTCSVLPDENDSVIERFLSQSPDAQVDLIDSSWGLDTNFGKQLLPVINGHDGFYYARLKKTC